MRRLIGLILLLNYVFLSYSQNIIKYEYWFDRNDGKKVVVESSSGNLSMTPDVSSLKDGIHCYTFRAEDTNGKWSSPLTKYFYRIPSNVPVRKLLKYEYWFDKEYASRVSSESSAENLMLNIDVKNLREGIHTLNFRISDDTGLWSNPLSQYFYRISGDNTSSTLEKLEYWIDRDYKNKVSVQTTNGIFNISQNVSSMREGIHCFSFRAKDSKGRWSSPENKFFYKVAQPSANALLKYEYWIDKDFNSKQVTNATNGLIALSLPVEKLREGLHSFNFRMEDSRGKWSSPLTKYFYRLSNKASSTDNKIIAYDYWFNDSIKSKQHVDVSPVNPLQLTNEMLLITNHNMSNANCNDYLLEVDENGVAKMYSKDNKFSIRFEDSNKRWSDIANSYFVDGVGVEVNAGLIVKDTTVNNPSNEKTSFLYFTAEKDDRIDISTDKACTIDVYDPFGVKVISRTLDDALYSQPYSCLRSGKYYILVHDVKDATLKSITVKFAHIHKYALLGCNTSKVGNNCDFNLLLSGSGFTNATKVVLRNGTTELVPSKISANSSTEISALFSLKNVPIGSYDIIATFDDGSTSVLSGQIKTEKTDTVSSVKVEILGNPFFLAGSTNIYTVKVTNTSNLQVKHVPVTISLAVDEFEDIPYVKFHNKIYDIGQDMTAANFAGNEELFALVKNYMDTDNDLRMFYASTDSAGHKYLKCDLMIPFIAPNGTYEIPFTVKKVVHNFQIYAFVSQLKLDDSDAVTKHYSGMRRINNSRECCSQLECYLGLVMSFIPGISVDDVNMDCLISLMQTFHVGIFNWLGCAASEGGETGDEFKEDMFGLAKSMMWAVLNCWLNNLIEKYGDEVAMKLFKTTISKLGNYWIGVAINLTETAIDCTVNKSWAGNCGDGGDDAGKDPQPLQSYDPNDKYGYTSASGSKYFNNDVNKMTYTIEFENDPSKATVAAHDVYIVDTLNAEVFDLSSFKAGYVSVGEKFANVNYETSNYSWDIDMRPRQNLITRVDLNYDDKGGIAKWHFSSIEPATDQPTTDLYNGFLPPNDADGHGLGYVTYTINLKESKDGAAVRNKAKIIFDYNDPLETPTWINIKDTVPPVSSMISPVEVNDSVVRLVWQSTDDASGPWKYDVYVQQGKNAPWFKIAKDITKTDYDYRFYDGIYYSFCVIATDSAGNCEKKELTPESTFYKNATSVYIVDCGGKYIEPRKGYTLIRHAIGSVCNVFDDSGKQIYSEPITSSEQKISLPSNGVYIIHLIKSGKMISKLKVFVR